MARRLLEGETEIRTARQHWSVFLPTAGVCLVAVVAGVLALVLTPSQVSGRSTTGVKTWVGAALGVAVVGVLMARWLRWRYTEYILTDHRVILRRGILSRYTESISLDRIQDTALQQRVLARIFRAGNVEIESAGRDGREILRRIGDAPAFTDALQRAIELHRAGLGGASQAPPVPGQPVPHGYTPPGGDAGLGGGYGPPPGYGPPRGGGV